ncbi:response regulator transcription factor [Alteromonas sp. MTD1]|uniref:response regulator transcription factor n=1 Tax=Alteromonas sp. MTD1 TaxID=3057962 RepID=UPI0036F27793
MQSILYVEDDYQLGDVVQAYLDANGYRVMHCKDANTALMEVKRAEYHCVVLDLTLPDEDGLVVLRKIKGFSDIPIIVCSARGAVEDRVSGLEFGADDYLPKPFSSKELLLRIKKLIERWSFSQPKQEILKVGSYSLDINRKALISDDDDISLTIGEYVLLALLAKNPGKVYSREQIIDSITGVNGPESTRAVDICISRLRKKIESEPKRPKLIKTSVGFGYYLENRSTC